MAANIYHDPNRPIVNREKVARDRRRGKKALKKLFIGLGLILLTCLLLWAIAPAAGVAIAQLGGVAAGVFAIGHTALNAGNYVRWWQSNSEASALKKYDREHPHDNQNEEQETQTNQKVNEKQKAQEKVKSNEKENAELNKSIKQLNKNMEKLNNSMSTMNTTLDYSDMRSEQHGRKARRPKAPTKGRTPGRTAGRTTGRMSGPKLPSGSNIKLPKIK